MTEIALVEREGAVVWDFGRGFSSPSLPSRAPRRAGRRGVVGEKTLFVDRSEPLGVNQIGKFLFDYDLKFNPDVDGDRGWTLRQWNAAAGTLDAPAVPPNPGSVLVIVHGTASTGSHIVSEMRVAPNRSGEKLLSDAARHYAAVLVFDHPTLSVSPMINALDLAKALEPYGDSPVDIVCHSRGGLVSSWWMGLVDRSQRARRCVFVGSPLQGTSLANPARLRASLNLLASYGRLLGDAGQATGFLTLPFAILKVVSATADITSRTPLLDAGFAMIPGISAQSRIDNNAELRRLTTRTVAGGGPPTRFFIQANFESSDVGWKIWQYARGLGLRAADAATDFLVFHGKNDLVVDTDAMIETVGVGAAQTHVFEGPGQGVHHTNYFRQEKTLDLIRSWLAIP